MTARIETPSRVLHWPVYRTGPFGVGCKLLTQLERIGEEVTFDATMFPIVRSLRIDVNVDPPLFGSNHDRTTNLNPIAVVALLTRDRNNPANGLLVTFRQSFQFVSGLDAQMLPEFLRKYLHRCIAHEVDEMTKVRGERVWDPHVHDIGPPNKYVMHQPATHEV